MVKGLFTFFGIATVLCAAFFFVTSSGNILQAGSAESAPRDITYVSNPVVQQVPPSPPATRKVAKPTAGMPPSVDQVLRSGTLVVISKGSQQMYVYRNGELWDTSPVSTGKPGKDTPAGVFPILQKRVHHRSNIYSNAPMPHMQRLTWGGIAIHAGKLPGYPASHGCIRLPKAFARELYGITEMGATTVVVVDQALGSEWQARQMALAMHMPTPGERGHLIQRPEPRLADLDALRDDTRDFDEQQPRLAEASPAPAEQSRPAIAAVAETSAPPIDLLAQTRTPPRGQTIQLAAPRSVAEAEAYWTRVSARHPELERFDKAIIPAVVNSRQYYRLRVTGPGAKATCGALRQAGTDCFPVR
ncbi:L,D-transpeptidase family protein [Citromicrobium bathyomarinum]|uniref:L,D-transpeptidase family protein n=1 Tax=Citromicrobium bathyomarinum TaxID=72174 RepID=UPI00315AB7C8